MISKFVGRYISMCSCCVNCWKLSPGDGETFTCSVSLIRMDVLSASAPSLTTSKLRTHQPSLLSPIQVLSSVCAKTTPISSHPNYPIPEQTQEKQTARRSLVWPPFTVVFLEFLSKIQSSLSSEPITLRYAPLESLSLVDLVSNADVNTCKIILLLFLDASFKRKKQRERARTHTHHKRTRKQRGRERDRFFYYYLLSRKYYDQKNQLFFDTFYYMITNKTSGKRGLSSGARATSGNGMRRRRRKRGGGGGSGRKVRGRRRRYGKEARRGLDKRPGVRDDGRGRRVSEVTGSRSRAERGRGRRRRRRRKRVGHSGGEGSRGHGQWRFRGVTTTWMMLVVREVELVDGEGGRETQAAAKTAHLSVLRTARRLGSPLLLLLRRYCHCSCNCSWALGRLRALLREPSRRYQLRIRLRTRVVLHIRFRL
ncbi:hypothetical protein VP01_7g7 [Puccinia sorghi]|uniref:Uncharacterized protein n=1 Tax=Puccinia sorghi TaxID=27349 RepID=A0A0L6UBC5_9BASI|nr:hypothetical protein VP01_7g7 [Puccinia sorghi]